MEKLNIRKMSREEAEFADEMAVAEGWNPGIHDENFFTKLALKVFLLLRLQEDQ